MNTTEKNYAFDLTLFKTIGYYQMIDPNCKKIFGFNIYNVINMMIVVFTSIITVIGLSGFFYKPNDITYEKISFKDIQILFYLACIVVGNLKICITIYNAKTIWKLFKVAHDSFLSNNYWKQNKHKINKCGKKFAKIFPWYLFIFLMTAFAWSIVPIVVNNHVASKETQNDENIYMTNVVNMRYPITAKTYNKFYKGFYVLEFIVVWYSAYGLVVFDLLTLGLLQLLATHYEIIASAYENFKMTKNENGKLNKKEIQKEFVSIILDCQTVNNQLKTIYGIARPIILIYMVGDSIGMITMPFLIVMFYTQDKSIFNSNVIAFSWTLLVVGIQLYMYCSLLQNVNERRENINFGLYSCDWTRLDIEIKKLILLAMRMNNSNNLKINVTFTKFIDLPIL
ncbi:odorant receptor 67a-like [Aphis gossypii]|uniref:odorant receptor 67a-like n=1 Tax=Aphis gossypii TaxID=80765 RepID=UPI002159798B|nr:odorant receptor 67a-like [Aphis gossypii]